MHRLVLFISLLLASSNLFSQKRTREFRLKDPDKQVSTSLYSRIVLLDKRDIQDNLGIVQVGALNSRARVVAAPALEQQLQQQLDVAVSGDKQGGELLIRLDKFCVAELTGAVSEHGYFDFTATLFAKDDTDAYREIASLDTSLVVSGMDVTKKILNSASRVVNNFITDHLNSAPASSTIYTYADIEQLPELLKVQFPLYTQQALHDGLYESFKAFRMQEPVAATVEFRDARPSSRIIQRDAAGKMKKVSAREYYAAVSNGQVYIACLGGWYPMEKRENDYFFYGPAQQTASATAIVGGALLLGVVGAIAMSEPGFVNYLHKLDFRNGSFIKVASAE